MTANEDLLRALMLGGLDGDASAHEALLRALAPALKTYFSRRLFGAAHDVDDLVQESLMAIHMRRASYDRGRPFMPWAYAIARYKLTDYFRRNSLRATENLDDEQGAASFEDACAARLDVEKLLESLPQKQGDAIRATRLRGESVADVASSTGLSASDVKVSVHRGLKALTAKLRNE